MKRAEPRKIILRTQRLQKIRKNLRDILTLAYEKEFSRLLNLKRLYQEKRISNGYWLAPSQRKREIRLSKMGDALMHAYDKSILVCSLGAACDSHKELVKKGEIEPSERSANLDMVWVPHFKAWFCLRCYEEYFKIKACENCRETDEKTAEISECSLCNRYICEYCENYCFECEKYYCDQCYHDHLIHDRCCYTVKKSTTQIKFLE